MGSGSLTGWFQPSSVCAAVTGVSRVPPSRRLAETRCSFQSIPVKSINQGLRCGAALYSTTQFFHLITVQTVRRAPASRWWSTASLIIASDLTHQYRIKKAQPAASPLQHNRRWALGLPHPFQSQTPSPSDRPFLGLALFVVWLHRPLACAAQIQKWCFWLSCSVLEIRNSTYKLNVCKPLVGWNVTILIPRQFYLWFIWLFGVIF